MSELFPKLDIFGGECFGGAQARRRKVDPALSPDFLDQGFSVSEIASLMGLTLGTLRVRRSQLKISLWRRATNYVCRKQFARIAVPQSVFEPANWGAAAMGMSAAELVADLLREIDRDGLYEAVLDRDDIACVA